MVRDRQHVFSSHLSAAAFVKMEGQNIVPWMLKLIELLHTTQTTMHLHTDPLLISTLAVLSGLLDATQASEMFK